MGIPTYVLLELRENEDDTFVWYVQNPDGTALDLTGSLAAQLMIRDSMEATSPVLTLSLGAGITLGGAAGSITISFTAANNTFLATQGLATYLRGLANLIITDSLGKKHTYLECAVVVKRSPTR